MHKFKIEATKFTVVGAANFALTFIVFTTMLKVLAMDYLLSLVAACVVGMLFSYVLNFSWVFKPEQKIQFRAQFLRFFLASALSIAMNMLALRYIVEQTSFDPFYVQMALIPFIVVFNFSTAKFWSFREGWAMSYKKRFVMMWAMFMLLAMLVVNLASDFGRNSVEINSGDFGLHMIAVETVYHNNLATSTLNEKPLDGGDMATYPQWSHFLVGYTAALMEADPLRVMQVWISVFLVLGALIMALRLVFVKQTLPTFPAMLSLVFYLATCAYIGFGLSGHIERNFFFPQFIGTVVAIGAYDIFWRLKLNPYIAIMLVLVVGILILPNMHLIPSLWFTLAALITIFFQAERLWLATLLCFSAGLICLYAWTGHGVGSGLAMIKMADINGWLLTRYGILSHSGIECIIGMALIFLTLAIIVIAALRSGPWDLIRLKFVPHSGLFAVCLLITAQLFMYLVMKQGSIYAITKYFYLLATELAVLIAVLNKPVVIGFNSYIKGHYSLYSTICIILLFIAQAPILWAPYDQSKLMQVRSKLVSVRKTLDPYNRVYPQFTAFDYAQNFYLAVAVMRIPSDTRTANWIQRGAIGETSFEWPDGYGIDASLGDDPAKRLYPRLKYEYSISLKSDKSIVEMAPGALILKRPDYLHVEIIMRYHDDFKLATNFLGRKGEVAFGIQAFDDANGRLIERRSLLVRKQTPQGVILSTDIQLTDLPSSVSRIDFGPVQEYVTWFSSQSPTNYSRFVISR